MNVASVLAGVSSIVNSAVADLSITTKLIDALVRLPALSATLRVKVCRPSSIWLMSNDRE